MKQDNLITKNKVFCLFLFPSGMIIPVFPGSATELMFSELHF